MKILRVLNFPKKAKKEFWQVIINFFVDGFLVPSRLELVDLFHLHITAHLLLLNHVQQNKRRSYSYYFPPNLADLFPLPAQPYYQFLLSNSFFQPWL